MQNFIHAIEQGRLVTLIRALVVVLVILTVSMVFLGWKFRGFAAAEAMDQAQVGSELAAGHGWSTRFIRPLAIWQLEKNLGAAPTGDFPDTFNAPLPPLLDSLAIRLAGNHMEFKRGDFIADQERFIAAASILCFLLSVVVEYFLLRRVFDQRLAFWAVVFTLVSDLCWRFTLTGLPQMLMLLLFNLALYAVARAIEAYLASERSGEILDPETGEVAPHDRWEVALLWLAAAGALFGLLALTHALTIWLFAGLLGFVAVYFRHRVPSVLVLVLAFGLVYSPWLVRTYRVSGSVFGLAPYALYDGVAGSTGQRMRSPSGPMTDTVELRFFRPKLEEGVIARLSHLVSDLGDNLIAAAFFVCLLHLFRRSEVNALRGAVLSMWVAGVVGMALAGGVDPADGELAANQIGVLFLPVMLGFGLAFVLVLFSRREAGSTPIGRALLFAGLFLISAVPLGFTLLPHNSQPFQYPPYFEPGINKLRNWTHPDEIIGSDMPWAVAWYADRRSVWIPDRIKDFMGLSDNAKLPGRLAGLFMTTFTRDQPFYSGIYKGEYQEWQPLIFGRTDIEGFPFKEGTLMLGDLSYTFFSDSKRWDQPGASKEAP